MINGKLRAKQLFNLDLSKSEIETNKYREKKGLPPIKRK